MSSRARAAAAAASSGEQRLRRASASANASIAAALDARSASALVGGAARARARPSSSIPAVVETSTRRVDALGRGERDVQRDPPAHRVAARARSAPGAAAEHVARRSAVEVDRPRAPTRAVAAAGRARARDSVRRPAPDDGVPARGRSARSRAAGRASRASAPIMPSRDRHLPAAARVLRRARALRHRAARAPRPGSRSTPLVLSLARDGALPCLSHVDERSAGFFALGLAKATGPPGGRSPAPRGPPRPNYLPAVIEAREARVPLIVLTADRPPELRDVGAGQTIDQLKLYGDAVKWFVEVGDARRDAGERCAGSARSPAAPSGPRSAGRPGPVHLNFPLREPLVLDGRCRPRTGGGGRADGRPWVARPPRARRRRPRAATLARSCRRPRRGVVVAGRATSATRRLGAAALRARSPTRAGWPLLADPLSGARRGAGAIAHYDALLRDAGVRARRAPGRRAARRRPADVEAAARVARGARRRSRSRSTPRAPGTTRRGVCDLALGADPARAARALAAALEAAPTRATRPGSAPGATPTRAPPTAIDAHARRRAQRAARRAPSSARRLPPEATLVVASSMPVRDVETFVGRARRRRRACSPTAARTGSTAPSRPRSASRAARRPGRAADRRRRARARPRRAAVAARGSALALTIVLVDNGGGGIFDFLPVATPDRRLRGARRDADRLDFAALAAAYGLHHAAVDDARRAARGARARRSASDGTHARSTCAPSAPRTSRCTARSGRPSARRWRR